MTVAVVVGAIENADRHMQQLTSNYRATYSADFQHYSDLLCDGGPPVLLLSCKGPSSGMIILNATNDSIVCRETTQFRLFSNVTSTVYQCEPTCVDSDCLNVYRYKAETFFPLNGHFGSIVFMCEGNTVDEIDAAYVYLGADGYCDTSSSTTASGRNYHIGRLGVWCPAEDGSGNREFVYDDTFTECRSKNAFTLDLAQVDDTDIVACVNGMKCEGKQCFFNFSDFWMEADVPKFYETCVDSLVAKTTFPTLAPMSPSFEYSAQFEASWAIVYDPVESSSSCGSSQGDAGYVTISCDVDANVSYINSTGIDPSSCSKTSPYELQCSTNGNTEVNKLFSVFYVSTRCHVI
jgi:hypothetical protein